MSFEKRNEEGVKKRRKDGGAEGECRRKER